MPLCLWETLPHKGINKTSKVCGFIYKCRFVEVFSSYFPAYLYILTYIVLPQDTAEFFYRINKYVNGKSSLTIDKSLNDQEETVSEVPIISPNITGQWTNLEIFRV